MKVSGSAVLRAPRDRVWRALNDPAVLVRTIPGCSRLEEVGQDAYRMTVSAGVASIKGTYLGEVRLHEQQPPESFQLRATGAGGPGTVSADVLVRLAEDGEGGTRLDYDADAVVGGMIGGVGQRVLAGVARKTAGEFFAAVDSVLNGVEMSAADTGAAPVEPGTTAPARVFEAPGGPAGPGGGDLARGALAGAVIALAGVVVGAWVAGRRTSRR